MSNQDKKENFEWESGNSISDENSKPLGGVRVKGFKKLDDATYADEELREKQLKDHVLEHQSVPYKQTLDKVKSKTQNEGDFSIESSVSGVSDMPADEKKVKKLIDKGDFGRKGLTRFDKK